MLQPELVNLLYDHPVRTEPDLGDFMLSVQIILVISYLSSPQHTPHSHTFPLLLQTFTASFWLTEHGVGWAANKGNCLKWKIKSLKLGEKTEINHLCRKS